MFNREHRTVIGVVVLGREIEPAHKTTTINAPGELSAKKTTDFGAECKGIARLAMKEASKAMLGQSLTIERCRVEVAYASGPSGLDGCGGPVLGDEL